MRRELGYALHAKHNHACEKAARSAAAACGGRGCVTGSQRNRAAVSLGRVQPAPAARARREAATGISAACAAAAPRPSVCGRGCRPEASETVLRFRWPASSAPRVRCAVAALTQACKSAKCFCRRHTPEAKTALSATICFASLANSASIACAGVCASLRKQWRSALSKAAVCFACKAYRRATGYLRQRLTLRVDTFAGRGAVRFNRRQRAQ
ncbi:MAG: hypothetical protein Pg6A_10610 [Termitinemataceae bacterium]|nr:MAG: hypothetical protein Pg6A_10610 [Termitinemataceae bacterium]